MRRVLPIVLLALAYTATASGDLPQTGVLVPGRSLGGLRLGATKSQVRAAWGTRFGVCRNCRLTTWYFTYRSFDPHGAGVTFKRGKAVALFTLWSPAGWRTTKGLRLGEFAARITQLYGALPRTDCGTYYALTMPRRQAVTAFYVDDNKVWGFGLLRRGVAICR
jgi:hypothetical protein